MNECIYLSVRFTVLSQVLLNLAFELTVVGKSCAILCELYTLDMLPELWILDPQCLSGMFIVSTSHPDPMEEFQKLTQLQHTQQHQQPHKLPKWFSPNILRYYVLLHDVAEHDEVKYEFTFYNCLLPSIGRCLAFFLSFF